MYLGSYNLDYIGQIIGNCFDMVKKRGYFLDDREENFIKNRDMTLFKDYTDITNFNKVYINEFNSNLHIFYFSVDNKLKGIEKEINHIINEKFGRGSNVKAIIITDVSINQFKKIINNGAYKNLITIFSFEELYIYAIDHFLNSYHIPVYEYNKQLYERISGDRNLTSLQTINSSNPVIKILGLVENDFVILVRQDPSDQLINSSYEIVKLVI